MKLLHLSDLHLGKRLCDVSLLEDQAYILDQIAAIAAREAVDAVLIAGDVYDKGVPPAEAVALLDQFLTVLAGQGCSVCLIAGNHDSAERLSFGAKLMDGRGVYFAPVYDGAVRCVTLQDGFGPGASVAAAVSEACCGAPRLAGGERGNLFRCPAVCAFSRPAGSFCAQRASVTPVCHRRSAL